MGIDEAERNLRSGFPYCGYQESRPAGSIGLCGGSYCRRSSSPRLGQGSGLQIWQTKKLQFR